MKEGGQTGTKSLVKRGSFLYTEESVSDTEEERGQWCEVSKSHKRAG